jgi:hypothetical protein
LADVFSFGRAPFIRGIRELSVVAVAGLILFNGAVE